MISGLIAYHFDRVDELEFFEEGNDQDVNCWTMERGYPFDEIVVNLIAISFGESPDEEVLFFERVIEQIKNGEIEL